MKNAISTLFVVFFIFIYTDLAYSQAITTTSKSCGNCGKGVSPYSKIGDRCPHCGVIWGKENSHKSVSKSSSFISPLSSSYSNNSSKKHTISSKSRKKQVREDNEEEKDNSTATQIDTESWILDKLRTNTPQEYYDLPTPPEGTYHYLPLGSSYNMYYYYFFDRYNLVIHYQRKYEKSLTKYKIVIPVYDIDRVYDYHNSLWITTKKESIVQYDLSDNKKHVTSVFSTKFEINSETDLCKRLHKAFIHLKKFYEKPPNNEVF